MNYSTEVQFGNDLIKNCKTTIIYSGSLFRTGSQSVTLVYGFGDNWEHTTEKQMQKNENNFSVEINLLNYNSINFCFRNSDNIWDNNNYLNYTAPILEPEKEYNFIINENLINNILDELFETDLSTYENSNITSLESNESQQEFSDIELTENSITSENSFEIEIPEDIPSDIQEFMVNTTDEPSLTSELEAAFSIPSNETTDIKKQEIVKFDMDSLVDEILAPVLECNNSEVSQSTELVEVKDSQSNLLVSPRSLNKFYILKKRIKLAIYKFFTAIPRIIEANFNENKN